MTYSKSFTTSLKNTHVNALIVQMCEIVELRCSFKNSEFTFISVFYEGLFYN